MSEYVSDTLQARLMHITGALHILDARLMQAFGMFQKHLAKVRPKALRNRNVHVTYTTCLKFTLTWRTATFTERTGRSSNELVMCFRLNF